MDGRNLRDSAFVESTDVDEGTDATNADTSLDMLEQHQAREQARLLQRFRELRQWQQQQQEQLMQQQQMQLEMLRGEQLRVQTLVASQRGAHWGDGKVSRPDTLRKSSPPLMTPPRRTAGRGRVGAELANTMMAVMPHASADSGLVASMGDTLEQPKDSLPRPIMYPMSPSDDDKYTNPELFSNPGSHGDDLQAVDDRLQFLDNRSDVGSDNFVLPPLPPEPRESSMGGLDGGGLKTLKTLQALMNTTAPNFLQQMLGLLPGQQKNLLLEQRQAAVEESASPTFSPVSSMPSARQSAASATAMPSMSAYDSRLGSQAQDAFQGFGRDGGPLGFPPHSSHLQSSQTSAGQSHRQSIPSHDTQWLQNQPPTRADQSASGKPTQLGSRHHHSHFQHDNTHQSHVPHEPQVTFRSLQDGSMEDLSRRGLSALSQEREVEVDDDDEEDDDEEELEVTVKENRSPDDRPITGVQGRKTFEQLLEEQLANEMQKAEEEAAQTEEQVSGPTKRPFLRKGQGIARFSQPIKRPPPKRSSGGGQRVDTARPGTVSRTNQDTGTAPDTGRSSAQGKPPVKRQAERKRASLGKKTREQDPLQPEKLRLVKKKLETGKKGQAVHGADIKQSSANGHKGHIPAAPAQRDGSSDRDENDTIPDDASFVAGLKEREKNEPFEAEDLEEFEMLEDIADNMSLVSNSSVVARLITPNKQRQKAAVSDLKTVLEKKKNAVSSPFGRNAAMRSLLSVNIPCPPIAQQQEDPQQVHQKPSEVEDDDQNDTLVEEEKSEEEGESHDVSVTESDDDDRQAGDETTENRVPSLHADAFRQFSSKSGEQNVYSGGLFSQKGQPLNGLDFSSKFSLFDHHKSADNTNSAGDCLPSPTKSVTRKVATIQSRLAAANDTATLLQKLSAHAGFLSSGFSQVGRETAAGVGHSEPQNDTSFPSSAMPEPLVIGGAGKSEETSLKNSSPVWTENTLNERVAYEEEEEENSEEDVDDDDDEDNEKTEMKNHIDHESNLNLVAQGVRWTAEEEVDKNHSNSNDHGQANSNNNAEFDDEDEWTSGAPQVSNPQPADNTGQTVESTPPTSKLMSRLFPNLKPKPTLAQQQQQQKLQMASTASVGDGIQSKILREKLAELETEIEKFRSENATLEKLRRDREEGLHKLKEEIARFEQEKALELKRLEDFKAHETKKLKQERKLFETYQKQVRAMPDKKDREEIEMLKTQLSDLQDEMKRKESRWTSNVTRLKARIAELEGENTELRDEMKLLERKRLEWMQTAKPAQQPPTVKSAPRSSTPTNGLVNGYHDGASSTMDVNNFNIPPKPLMGLSEKAPVPPSTQMSAAGAATKMAVGPGSHGHSTSGGESMPRGLGSTPSMIEGMSPMSLGDGGEGPAVGVKKTNNPPAVDRPTVDKGNRQYEETQYPDGKVERVYSNGAREVLFANGTRKEIASDGQYIIVSFFNGDIKQIFPDQHVVYYYAEAQTTHTTFPDRLEVLQFSNGQTEKHYPDGTKEITFPDQTVKYLFPNGTEESIFQDGTIMKVDKNGERILEFPNGQREIHTQQYKRREYPDGTVKTLHNDGRQETRYSTGRVRLKDKDGNVLLDRMY